MGMSVSTLRLAGEDLAYLARALASLDLWPLEEGLAWLIRQGARAYLRDQRAWEELNRRGVPDRDPDRLELQRRELAAHVFSMRARVLRTELERDALLARVDALGQEYEALRRHLAQLRWELERLKVALGDAR